jgi:hypothetical protein
MKSKLLLCLALVLSSVSLAPVLSAHGEEMEIRITPKRLDRGGYAFSIATKAVKDVTAFHVTITSKAGFIPSNSKVCLCLVSREPDILRIEPVDSAPRITLEKSQHIWKLDFVASPELLKKPNLSCVFMAIPYDIVNSKIIYRPGVDFYEIMLQVFLK